MIVFLSYVKIRAAKFCRAVTEDFLVMNYSDYYELKKNIMTVAFVQDGQKKIMV